MEDPLTRIIRRETLAQALAQLTDGEILVAWLRSVGLNDSQIAQMLGVRRSTVGMRMRKAQQRIAEALPELAPVISGRKKRRGRPRKQPAEG